MREICSRKIMNCDALLHLEKTCHLERHCITVGAHLSLVLTSAALVRVIPEVGDGDETTKIADVTTVRIRTFKQTFIEKLCRAMRDLTIALHFPETQTAITAMYHINNR